MTPQQSPVTKASGKPARRGIEPRIVLGVTIGALLTLFAVVNSQDVEVHFLVATVTWPLILVIAISALLGATAGALLAHRRGRARARRRR